MCLFIMNIFEIINDFNYLINSNFFELIFLNNW